MRYGMVVDTKRCIGCHTCSVGCKIENNLPNGILWNQVATVGGDGMDAGAGQFPNTSLSYRTIQCMHCENPACVAACPVGATYKDPETGIVRQDYDKCIGCRTCMVACPYTGVRSYNWKEPEYMLDVKLGAAEVPEHQAHVVEKCQMCYHRIEKGQQPKCVEVCLAQAHYWGDLDDPDSEVSQILRKKGGTQLLPEHGTNPSVYYIV